MAALPGGCSCQSALALAIWSDRNALPAIAALADKPCPCQSALSMAIWSDRNRIPQDVRDRLKVLVGKYL